MDRDALIAHRRRMGMIPTGEMPATREDADCGCGGGLPSIPNYKPRKTPEIPQGSQAKGLEEWRRKWRPTE